MPRGNARLYIWEAAGVGFPSCLWEDKHEDTETFPSQDTIDGCRGQSGMAAGPESSAFWGGFAKSIGIGQARRSYLFTIASAAKINDSFAHSL